jgi:hypothetical protein
LSFCTIRDEIRLLRQANEKAPQPLFDKPELVPCSVPSAPRLISLAAIRYCEYVVAAALSGRVVSVSDAERATTAGVASVTSIDRVERDGRTGVVSLLLYFLWMALAGSGRPHC